MFPVIVVYAGLLAALAGFLSVMKPLRRLGIRTRARGAVVLVGGFLVVVCGMVWPAPLHTVQQRHAGLDDFMPAYQFNEFHSIRVHAPPAEVYRAIREVTADEIFLFRTLTWIRNPRLPGHGPENILNAPEKKPLLDVATRSSFRVLREETGREIVLGTVVLWDGVSRIADAEGFRAFRQPGNALAAINFLVRDDGRGWSTLTTETRVFATDNSARRRFAGYWRLIYPGSSLIRFNWLRAIRRRAQRAAPGTSP